MPSHSILQVEHFPYTLRRQLHAVAALEGKRLHEIVIRFIVDGLKKHRRKGVGK